MKLHNPIPQSLDITCKNAASILEHFIKGHNELDSFLIPQHILKQASGYGTEIIIYRMEPK